MRSIFLNSYGDRSPKSTLGRVFCILWIITGLIIISIFIAMVTASLSATTHPYFPIHGSLVSDDLFFSLLSGDNCPRCDWLQVNAPYGKRWRLYILLQYIVYARFEVFRTFLFFNFILTTDWSSERQ